MSALRFLYKKVLKRRDIAYDDLIFPKVPRKLPVVLSPDEVTRMIAVAPTLLQRTILIVLYATGVRRTEASLIKVADIDSECMVIHIRQGKGSRDRDIPMTPKLLEILREYFRWKATEGVSVPQHRGTSWN
jgi:integrase/recombinase XerD